MIANRMKPVLTAIALFAGISPALAWDNDGRHDFRHHRVENNRWDRQGDGRFNRPAQIDRTSGTAGSIQRVRRQGNFYGGGLEAYGFRGHGIYFLRDADWPAGEQADGPVIAPKTKVIDVETSLREDKAFAPVNGCSWEMGVCVIRGGN